MNIRDLLLIGIVSTVIALLPHSNNAATSFAASKENYNKTVIKIESDFETQKEAALTQYEKHLVMVRDMFQEQGDLDNLVAVMEEIKRFQAQKNVPDEPEMTSPVITKIQECYFDTISEAEDTKQQRYLDLTKKWIQYLDRLKKTLTKEGKIEEAIEIKTEITRLSEKVSIVESGFSPDAETRMVACPECNGKEYIASECTHCDGTGKCKSCHGTGYKKGLRNMLRCVSCRGTGECRKCGGTGELRQECSKCRGVKQIRVAATSEPEYSSSPAPSASIVKPPPSSKSKAKPKPKSVNIQQELEEYIETNGRLFKSYKNQEFQQADFEEIVSNPTKHIGELFTSNVLLIHAFPRSVSVGIKTGSKKIKVELIPYSHAVGNKATRFFKQAGKAAKAQITYGLVNEDNFTLFDIKTL